MKLLIRSKPIRFSQLKHCWFAGTTLGVMAAGARRSIVISSRCWWCRRATTTAGWYTEARARGHVHVAAAAARRAKPSLWKRRQKSRRFSPTWNSARRLTCVASRTRWLPTETSSITPSSRRSNQSRVTDVAATLAAPSRTRSATCHKIYFPLTWDAHHSA